MLIFHFYLTDSLFLSLFMLILYYFYFFYKYFFNFFIFSVIQTQTQPIKIYVYLEKFDKYTYILLRVSRNITTPSYRIMVKKITFLIDISVPLWFLLCNKKRNLFKMKLNLKRFLFYVFVEQIYKYKILLIFIALHSPTQKLFHLAFSLLD